MAKLTLSICYKCKGLTLEEHQDKTYNSVGGCAITLCELCGYSIPNTALVYSKDVNVYVKKGVIK